MSNFKQLMQEDRRLTILRLLADSDDYAANQYLLHMALPGFGHTVSEDAIRVDLDWLAEQALITITETGGVVVAKITKRGDDVAAGRARATGVKRPRPE